jgi:hypothetical protein
VERKIPQYAKMGTNDADLNLQKREMRKEMKMGWKLGE